MGYNRKESAERRTIFITLLKSMNNKISITIVRAHTEKNGKEARERMNMHNSNNKKELYC